MLNNFLQKKLAPTYSQETIDILRLIRSQNVGSRTFISLIKFFGSASRALENIADFSLRGGRSKPITLYTASQAAQEIAELNKQEAYLLTYRDLAYPEFLLEIADFPPVITYKGRVELLKEKMIAIVGARNSSINGQIFAKNLAKELTQQSYVTVSGLARGIDTAVHMANINQTVAVLAGGVDFIYPPENKKLYQQITENGLILAELPVGSKPLSKHFPQRNRIIAGLSLATLVIEAGIKSGSLITANFALEQGREVFAVPGFPLDPRSMGSNKLIKEGAYLLESAADVIDNLTYNKKVKKSFEDRENYCNNFKSMPGHEVKITNRDRKNLVNALSAMPIGFEEIIEATGFSLPIIYTICLELELAGRIIRHPGNKISLIY